MIHLVKIVSEFIQKCRFSTPDIPIVPFECTSCVKDMERLDSEYFMSSNGDNDDFYVTSEVKADFDKNG